MIEYRLDRGSSTLAPPTRTAQGYLKVSGHIARVGVLEYADASMPDGIRRELRLPEDVFSAESLAGFAGAPVTEDHPAGGVLLDPHNTGSYARGTVLGPGRRDGDHVAVDMVITDAALIHKVASGQKVQLSAGYRVIAVPTPGGVHPMWGRHDFRQTGIIANHAAVVDVGRAGTTRLRIDTADGRRVLQQRTVDRPELLRQLVAVFPDRAAEYGYRSDESLAVAVALLPHHIIEEIAITWPSEAACLRVSDRSSRADAANLAYLHGRLLAARAERAARGDASPTQTARIPDPRADADTTTDATLAARERMVRRLRGQDPRADSGPLTDATVAAARERMVRRLRGQDPDPRADAGPMTLDAARERMVRRLRGLDPDPRADSGPLTDATVAAARERMVRRLRGQGD